MPRQYIFSACLFCIASGASAAEAGEFSRPDVIAFGATATQMESALTDQCKTMNTRRIDPPFLPDIQEKQLQIDCDGFVFFEKPRWAEFVIGDDSLEMVWILTDADEEAELRAAMTKAYGPPSYVADDIEAFPTHDAALRKDKPEVLFYSSRLAPAFEARFSESK